MAEADFARLPTREQILMALGIAMINAARIAESDCKHREFAVRDLEALVYLARLLCDGCWS